MFQSHVEMNGMVYSSPGHGSAGRWKQMEPESRAGDRRWGHLPSCVGFKNSAEHYASGWVKYLLLPLFIMGLCRGGQESRPILGLQDLSLIKLRAGRLRIPGAVIKTTEGYLE